MTAGWQEARRHSPPHRKLQWLRLPRRRFYPRPQPRRPPGSATSVAPHRSERRSATSAEPTCASRRLRLRKPHQSWCPSSAATRGLDPTSVHAGTTGASQGQSPYQDSRRLRRGRDNRRRAGCRRRVLRRLSGKAESARGRPRRARPGFQFGQRFQFQRRDHGLHLKDSFG